MIFCNFFYIITESSKNKIDIQYIMGRRSVTKKLLKLKKGGEKKSKRSTKQTPNQQARHPEEFTFGDVHKPTLEQTIYGLHNNKIVPIEYHKLESDSANFESVPTTELQKKLRTKTEKAAHMCKKKLTRKSLPSSSSSEGSFETERKTGFAFKKSNKLKHKPRKSSDSSDSSDSTHWFNNPHMIDS